MNNRKTIERYKDLALYMAYTSLRVEASRNYLNFIWWVLDPLLMLGTYCILFGIIFPPPVSDFVPFLLTGLVCWQWFGNALSHTMPSILQSGTLMRQVYFPKVILPISVLIVDGIKFFFILVLLLLFLWIYGYPPSITYIFFPVVLLIQAIWIYGISLITAALIPFFPDLRLIILAILQLIFFLSGALFSPKEVPADYLWLFYMNPMAVLIEAWRSILMYRDWPNWNLLAQVGVVAIVLIFLAAVIYRFLDHKFPNIVEE